MAVKEGRVVPAPTFSHNLVQAIRTLIYQHHTVYPHLPPQGIYFESLVERAFRITGKPFTPIEPSTPNMPAHDLRPAHFNQDRDRGGNQERPDQHHQGLYDREGSLG